MTAGISSRSTAYSHAKCLIELEKWEDLWYNKTLTIGMGRAENYTDKDPEELPGIRKKSFVLPFAGGEIWFEHLDGIYQYTGHAIQKLRADTPIFRRPSSPGYIAFVLDETVLTEELISEIAAALSESGKTFMRAAFVGADKSSCKKLKKLLYGHGFAVQFFDGIEPAKEWLLPVPRI